MNQAIKTPLSRRRFLKTTGAVALAAGAGPAVIIPGRAQPRTLKILTARYFVSAIDRWLERYAQAWGENNDVRVEVTFDKRGNMAARLEAEIGAQQGCDILGQSGGVSELHDQVIDHREIYQECEHRYGRFPEFVLKQISSRPGGKVFEISRIYGPVLTHYRRDLWESAGIMPDTWENVLRGGRKIRFYQNTPVWLALAPSYDGEQFLRSLLYSFGASVQDVDNRPVLKSRASLDAIRFVKSLYDQAMSEEVASSDISSMLNNQAMLRGEASLTLNAPNITRQGEELGLPVADQILLARIPQGPVRRLCPVYFDHYRIFKYSSNINLASRFLVDFVGQTRGEFIASNFMNFPLLPATVPDLAQLLAHDAGATPPDKYRVLAQTLEDSTTEHGFPGHKNFVSDEVQKSGLISRMFASAATAKMTPEEALTQADQEVRRIYDKWRALGKI